MADALTEAGVPFVYVDSEAGDERFAQRKFIIAPTFDFIGERYWRALNEGAGRGSQVFIGPLMPVLDAQLFPASREAPEGLERRDLLDPEARQELVAYLSSIAGVRSDFRTGDSGVDVTVHEDRRGPRVIFLLNPSRRAVNAKLTMPQAYELHDLISGERYESRDEQELQLSPRRVRIFELRDPPAPGSTSTKPRPPSARRKKDR